MVPKTPTAVKLIVLEFFHLSRARVVYAGLGTETMLLPIIVVIN